MEIVHLVLNNNLNLTYALLARWDLIRFWYTYNNYFLSKQVLRLEADIHRRYVFLIRKWYL